jgi:hypothetical protein
MFLSTNIFGPHINKYSKHTKPLTTFVLDDVSLLKRNIAAHVLDFVNRNFVS